MATYMARWGPKGFLVSPSKIVPFDSFTTDMKLKSDSENDTSGTEPINTRGRELRTISFETQYYAALGVDPRAQIDEWENLLGQAYPLYIGSKRFGPPRMKLTQVSTSDLKLTPNGDMISCKIAISMEEYSEGKTSQLVSTSSTSSASKSTSSSSKKSSTSSSSQTSAARQYVDNILDKRQAMNATASKADKAAKKA